MPLSFSNYTVKCEKQHSSCTSKFEPWDRNNSVSTHNTNVGKLIIDI